MNVRLGMPQRPYPVDRWPGISGFFSQGLMHRESHSIHTKELEMIKGITAATIALTTLMSVSLVHGEGDIADGVRHDVRAVEKGAEHDAKAVDKGAKHLDKERHKEDKHVDKEAKKHL